MRLPEDLWIGWLIWIQGTCLSWPRRHVRAGRDVMSDVFREFGRYRKLLICLLSDGTSEVSFGLDLRHSQAAVSNFKRSVTLASTCQTQVLSIES